MIRSLTISQRLLGTRAIVLIHHADCGMLAFRDDEFRAQVQDPVRGLVFDVTTEALRGGPPCPPLAAGRARRSERLVPRRGLS